MRVANPDVTVTKTTTVKETSTMAKRGKKRATKKSGSASASTRKRKKRSNPSHAAAAPKKRRAKKKSHHAGASKRRARRAPHAAAPHKGKRHKGKRRHKKNPALHPIVIAALAMLGGTAAFVAANAGGYLLTQQLDPTMASLARNRRILAGVAALGGLVAAHFGAPVVGAAVAAGGLTAAAGNEAFVEVTKALQPSTETKMGAIARMGAVQQLPPPQRTNTIRSLMSVGG